MKKISNKKKIQNYFAKKKDIQACILMFLENIDEINEYHVFEMIQSSKIQESPNELKHFLYLMLNLANNHHRQVGFFPKIESILLFLKNNIKKYFSDFQIFDIFASNKRILLFLFEKEIITINNSIIECMLTGGDSSLPQYYHFFYPEIKEKIEEKKIHQIKEEILKFNSRNFEQFNEKRHLGENESYVCSLIRNDSIEEFVSYFNHFNLSFSSKILPSIFETNPYLIYKNPTLIEYASFYGSIQIFQFLYINNIKINQNILIYGIHSNNPRMIREIEEKIEKNDNIIEKCFKESIKCHHNELANYFKMQILYDNSENSYLIDKFISYCFQYYNYNFFPDDFDNDLVFFYLHKYQYLSIFKLLLKMKRKCISKAEKIIYKVNLKSTIKQKAKDNDLYDLYS